MTQATTTSPIKLLKVKRKAEDAPVPILFYEKNQEPFLFKLDSSQMISQGESGVVQLEQLFELMRTNAKRQKVKAEVVSPSLAAKSLEEDTNSFVYDYYHLVPRQQCSLTAEDLSKLAVAEVVFDDTTIFLEDEFEEDEVADDDEDSNAEDHYGNEYPDENNDGSDWETDYDDAEDFHGIPHRSFSHPKFLGYDSDECFDGNPYADWLDDEDDHHEKDPIRKLMEALDALDHEGSAEGVLGHILDHSDCNDENDPDVKGHYYCDSCEEEVYYKRERTVEEKEQMIREFYELKEQMEEDERRNHERITELIDNNGSE